MGIAQYNRGSAIILREIERSDRPKEFLVIDRLNNIPLNKNMWGERQGAKPFDLVYIQYDEQHKIFWLHDSVKKENGFGYMYTTIRAIMEQWNITIISYDATTKIFNTVIGGRSEKENLSASSAKPAPDNPGNLGNNIEKAK